tara:strand:+ start:5781 stop:6098 length:318 start_codon:yes stop_codon:yes gene_type:complete
MSPYRNRKKRLDYGKEYRKRTGYDRFRRYGMSKEEYDRRVSECNSMCPICGEVAKLVVDHCHKTNIIRGLICDRCNNGLGCFKDNIKILKKASEYLRRVHGHNTK